MKLDQKFLRFLLIQIILVSSISYIAVSGIKLIYAEPRPCEFLDSCPDSYSFPSRHTGVAFAVATILSIYISRLPYRILFFVIAGLVGYWRVSMGVHTIYDIVGGAIVGLVVGIGVYYFVRRVRGPRYNPS